jgi:hypothetical protein
MTAEEAAQSDELHALFEASQKMHDLFEGFMVGGFTEDQALKLIANMMTGMLSGNDA